MGKTSKNKVVFLICSVFILLMAGACFYQSDFFRDWSSKREVNPVTTFQAMSQSDEQNLPQGVTGGKTVSEDGTVDAVPVTIAVYLCGAVKNPGVYKLPDGARICDAVEAAGGLKKTASRTAVNMAELLCDGEQIQFPTKKQVRKQNKTVQSDVMKTGQNEEGTVDINRADADALQQLPGIGASRAADIIAYRTEHGDFQNVEDIMKVSGIKEGIYRRIKDCITV